MVEQVRVLKGISKDEVLNQIRAATFDAVLEVLRSGVTTRARICSAR
jgi:hypothetical protein